jgi:predicted ATP-binding protein involved in virulence
MSNQINLNYKIKVKELSLKNFRSFANLNEVYFDEQLTVFVGANGAGKTSILDAVAGNLQTILDWVFLQLGEGIDEPYITDKVITNGTNDASVKITYGLTRLELLEDDSQEEELNQKNDEPEYITIEENDQFEFRLIRKQKNSTFDVEKDELERTPLQSFVSDLSNRIHLYKNNDENAPELPVLVYYGCNSVSTDISNETLRLDWANRFLNLYEGALNPKRFSFDRFFEWFDRRQRKANYFTHDIVSKDNILAELRKGLSEALSESDLSKLSDLQKKIIQFNEAIETDSNYLELSFVKSAIEWMFSDEENNIYYQDLHIVYDVKEGSKMVMNKKDAEGNIQEIEISQFSSGEKALFALVADLTQKALLANPHYLNKKRIGKEKPCFEDCFGVVLIDEIELHLHPRWQGRIITRLIELFPNLQFIVTTHSPTILSEIEAKHVQVLRAGQIESPKYANTKGHDIENLTNYVLGFKSKTNILFENAYEALSKDDWKAAEDIYIKLASLIEGGRSPRLAELQNIIDYIKSNENEDNN